MSERTRPEQQPVEVFKSLPDTEVVMLEGWRLRKYMSDRLHYILSHSPLVADTLLQSYARDENTTNRIDVELPDGSIARLEKWPEPEQAGLHENQYELFVEGPESDTDQTIETQVFISPRLFMINEAIYDYAASDVPIEVNRYGTSVRPNLQCEPEGRKSEADMKLQALGILRDLERVICEAPPSQRCV